MESLLRFIGWMCRCEQTSRVFKDQEGYYVRCLDCGRRLSYDWEMLGDVAPQNVHEHGTSLDHGVRGLSAA
jgi:hypothetical protein